jgi:hypothetical protein
MCYIDKKLEAIRIEKGHVLIYCVALCLSVGVLIDCLENSIAHKKYLNDGALLLHRYTSSYAEKDLLSNISNPIVEIIKNRK